ncbi:putative malate dehydrogenase 1B [Heliangelus exortis]|uniref:putative malate dehydrogenase 1B n=1 Tax=Heliangelus exortis TaxID=472823 RepID=UPI003A8DD659
MARLVLAGKANCPHYAKAELLADYLQANLPDFRVHKITQHPDKWEEWLQQVCERNGWEHQESPIIWRELLYRGGKGLLLGGVEDFLQYVQRYYGVSTAVSSEEMLDIAEENLQAHIEIEKEEEEFRSLINPLQIWITSASSPTCYQLIPLLASGEVFGLSTEISLHLLDASQFEEVLHGLALEAADLACPLLRSVGEHTEVAEAFAQADVVILLDDVLVNPEVQPLESCIREVGEICQVYAPLIEKNAKREVRVIASGRTFVNLKAVMIMTYGPSIKPENVIAVASSWESAAKAMLARKLNLSAAEVKDVIVWGNISGCNCIDLSHGKAYGYDSGIRGPPDFPHPLLDVITDREWLHSAVLSEQSSLRSRLSHSAGMLPAHAAATALTHWYQGSPPGEAISVGVLTKGQYGIPEGIVFSVPVRFHSGTWEVITELEMNEVTREALGRAAHELLQEKLVAMKEIQEMHPYGADNSTSDKDLHQEMETLPAGSL